MTNTNFKTELARFAGELAASLSFNKSIGQIYGLLYMNNEPLSLDDIASQLSMSKGNASINLRTLESWGAVRSVATYGSRRDHYQANYNLKQIALRRLKEGVEKRVELVDDTLQHLVTGAKERGEKLDPHLQKKLSDLKSTLDKAKKALALLPKLSEWI